MAFGQQTGPAASSRQVQELLDLLKEDGHVDFRDARGPMGFTQRQAAGRFTRDEAEAFIQQLQEADADSPIPPAEAEPPAQELDLRLVPAEQMAAELRRRGWTARER